MELLDVYDENKNLTGRIVSRDGAFGKLLPGDRILLIHVCVFNKNGEMLIQQRHPKKDRYPNMWDVSAGGFAMSGESSEEAVLRELREELGEDLVTEGMCLVKSEPFVIVIDDFYMAFSDVDPADVKFLENEISAVRWEKRDTVIDMIKDGSFVDYPIPLIETMYEAAGKALAERNA